MYLPEEFYCLITYAILIERKTKLHKVFSCNILMDTHNCAALFGAQYLYSVFTNGSVHPQLILPNCQLCINTEPTTSIGRLIKSSRL